MKRKRRRKHSIVEEVFGKLLATYMLNTFTWAIGTLVDGAIIGHFLGLDSMAAYGLIWPLTLIYALTGSIISGGARSLYTRLVGQGKTDEANNAFSLACVMSLVLSCCMVLLTLVFLSPLAGLLGANGRNEFLRPLICQFLSGIIIGLPFDNGAKILSGFMGIDSDQRRVVIATIAMTITDIAGDLAVVLVFHGGMYMLGITTALGQVVFFSVLATHFLRKKRMLRFSLKGLSGTREKIKMILTHGAPTGVARISNALCGIAVNRILSAAATSSFIAAYSVHKSMGSLIGATYFGVADTVWTLSSVYYGEEDKEALDELQRTALRYGLIITVFTGVIVALFPRLFAGIYIGRDNPETMKIAAQAVRLFAVSVPLYLLTYTFDDYLMGVGRLKASNIYSFFLECGAVVPVVWLMVKQFGGAGAWFATPVALLIMVLAALVYIIRWEGQKISDKRLLLAPDFGTAAGEELRISATTMVAVLGMSRIAGLFCRENGVDDRKSYALALCIEELGSNIMEHGFSDGKQHSTDVRILAKQGEIILRIRDNCRPFNLLERYEMAQVQDDAAKNVGIRMVVKMCRDVQYLSIMNTNNLIIRI